MVISASICGTLAAATTRSFVSGLMPPAASVEHTGEPLNPAVEGTGASRGGVLDDEGLDLAVIRDDHVADLADIFPVLAINGGADQGFAVVGIGHRSADGQPVLGRNYR